MGLTDGWTVDINQLHVASFSLRVHFALVKLCETCFDLEYEAKLLCS